MYVDVWQRKGQINRVINTGELVRRVLGSRFCFGVSSASRILWRRETRKAGIFGKKQIVILSEGAVH